MALIISTWSPNPNSLRFSPLQRPTKTKPFSCKVVNYGHRNWGAQRKQSHLHSSFAGRSRKEVSTLSNGVSVTDQEEKPHGRKWFYDVVLVFGGRTWNTFDILLGSIFVAMHLLAVCAPFFFSWPVFFLAAGISLVTGLGITLSYHRNLTHRSFKLPKWLEYFFAYCGLHALQKDPIDWVRTHRYHHQFCDSERDPHSPNIQGFWFSHMNWIFDTNTLFEKGGESSNVGDLEKQPFYKFLESTYLLHVFALGALLYALGGIPFLVWGMGVRIVLVWHITFFVNSVCHIWGNQAWNTGDLSKNNWWVALLTLGEGWHNNHHAFEYSARQGLEWWQLDLTWYVIQFLQVIGLATEVKLPTEVQKQKMAFNN